jgi:N-methylhydantoinase A
MLIGLDAGGTHTDVVLMGDAGPVDTAKVATDPDDLFGTIIQGLDAVTRAADPDAIQRLVLSTTLATNLVVQRKLPPVGMVVAAGPGMDPSNFATNDDFYIVRGALDHRGREIEPLDREGIVAIGEELRAKGIALAGVVSKFSVRNPAHEKAMAALLAPYVEQVFMGHLYSGSLNFPRRIATTYLNAAVFPVHKLFFRAVRASLRQRGLSMPIRILKPDGGNMNLASSLEYPAQTILSGPSASVMGAIAYAPGDRGQPGARYWRNHHGHGLADQWRSPAGTPRCHHRPLPDIDSRPADPIHRHRRRQRREGRRGNIDHRPGSTGPCHGLWRPGAHPNRRLLCFRQGRRRRPRPCRRGPCHHCR